MIMKTLLLLLAMFCWSCGTIEPACDLTVSGAYYIATWKLAPESTQTTNDPGQVPCSTYLPKNSIVIADRNFTEVPTDKLSPVVYPVGYRYVTMTDDMCYLQIKQLEFLGCVFEADLFRIEYPNSACKITVVKSGDPAVRDQLYCSSNLQP